MSAAHEEDRTGRAVGMLLDPITHPTSNILAEQASWTRVGLSIWSIDNSRPEVEGSLSKNPYKGIATYLEDGKTATKKLPYRVGHGPASKKSSGLYG